MTSNPMTPLTANVPRAQSDLVTWGLGRSLFRGLRGY
jgi:hypothetical protein